MRVLRGARGAEANSAERVAVAVSWVVALTEVAVVVAMVGVGVGMEGAVRVVGSEVGSVATAQTAVAAANWAVERCRVPIRRHRTQRLHWMARISTASLGSHRRRMS